MAEVDMPIAVRRDSSSLDNPYTNASSDAPRKAPPMERVVHEKKPTLGDKFKDTFSGDIRDVAEDFIVDEVFPGILEGVLDFFRMWFFGSRGRGYDRRGRRDDRHDYTRDYDEPSYYRDSRRRDDRQRSPRRVERVDYREIVIYPGRGESMVEAKAEAEKVVRSLRARIDKYGQATVQDLYIATGLGEMSSWVDTERGWVDENDIGLTRVHNGYLIDVADATDLR